MSLVSTLRPKNVPFPVGAACARVSRAQTEFAGGHIPIEKYPLVSRPPPQGVKDGESKIVSKAEWAELNRLLNEDNEEAEMEAERERRLREASEELRRSWGETGKSKTDTIRERLEEDSLRREEEDRVEAAAILEMKRKEREAVVAAAKEVLNRRAAEEHLALDSAVILTEVLQENAKSLALKRQRAAMERERNREIVERCQKHWEEYDQELTKRTAKLKQTEKEVADFQRHQQKVKKMVEETDRRESLEWRRHAEDLSAKLSSAERVKQDVRKKWLREDLVEEMMALDEKRRSRRKMVKEVEDAELVMARQQELDFVRRNVEYEKEFLKRRVDVGRRQEAARKWIRENVLPVKAAKERKAEDDIAKARKFEEEREKLRLQKVSDHKHNANLEQARFQALHRERRIAEKEERVLALAAEAEKDLKEVKEHEIRVEEGKEEEQRGRDRHLNFWECQRGEMRQKREQEMEEAKSMQDRKREEESFSVRGVAARGRELIAEQESRGPDGDAKPIEKALKGMEGILKEGSPPPGVVVAADASGIRIVGRKLGKGSSPNDNRERMSLNWDD